MTGVCFVITPLSGILGGGVDRGAKPLTFSITRPLLHLFSLRRICTTAEFRVALLMGRWHCVQADTYTWLTKSKLSKPTDRTQLGRADRYTRVKNMLHATARCFFWNTGRRAMKDQAHGDITFSRFVDTRGDDYTPIQLFLRIDEVLSSLLSTAELWQISSRNEARNVPEQHRKQA